MKVTFTILKQNEKAFIQLLGPQITYITKQIMLTKLVCEIDVLFKDNITAYQFIYELGLEKIPTGF